MFLQSQNLQQQQMTNVFNSDAFVDVSDSVYCASVAHCRVCLYSVCPAERDDVSDVPLKQQQCSGHVEKDLSIWETCAA